MAVISYNVFYYLQLSLLCFVIVWFFKLLWKLLKIYLHSRNFPGPNAYPFIGNLHLLFRKDIINVCVELLPKYPSWCRIWLGIDLFLSVHSPEYTETVLNSSKLMEKHTIYDFTKDIIGTGLILCKGSQWRKHRKIISPSFNTKSLELFIETFSENSRVLINVLNSLVGVKNIKLYHILCRYTLNTICETSMGVNLNVLKGEDTIGDVMEGLTGLLNYRIFSPWLYSDFVWNLTHSGRTFKYLVKQFHEKVSSIINEKLKLFNFENKTNFLHFNLTKKKERTAILDTLIEDSNFTEDELRDEVCTFVAAGTETTAGTFCFVAVILGLFQEIQQNVYEEIMNIFGVDGPITAEGLLKMKYSERVIKETMRLFPTVPFIARNVTEDVKIGNKLFPQGSGIVINIFLLHRNPEYWTDPLKFDPDRFLPEETAKRSPYIYMPFSMGPRICIGWKFAMLNMKTLLVDIVRNFKIHTEYTNLEEIEVKMRFVLRLSKGPKVWLEKR